jgi:cation transport regulator ChaC
MRAVYLHSGRYVAADYDGSDAGLVTLVAGESNADSLAALFNREIETEDEMAKGKKTKKAKANGEAKESKLARITLPVGTILRRTYHGKEYEVKALGAGFTMDGDAYTSLTDVAKKITGYKSISGPKFFEKVLAEKAKAA